MSTANTHIEYIKRAMSSYRGDDLERANIAFGRLSEKELGEQHGQSGKTRREIWQSYKDERAAHDAAMAWLNRL